MGKIIVWSRRILLGFLLLVVGSWIWAQGSQWLFRWRAKQLLADIQTLQVNHSTGADAQALSNRWAYLGEVATSCRDDGCDAWITLRKFLPRPFQENDDPEKRNWPLFVANCMGIRNEAFSANFHFKQNVLVSRGFSVAVAIPENHWLDRGGAYVPDLLVSSSEVSEFRDSEKDLLRKEHPFRLAR